MKTQIHCPDCATGFLRILSDEEPLKMFPSSRAAFCVQHPETLRTQTWIHPRTGEMHERWGKPKRMGLFCDKCKHFRDADERSIKHPTNKPKSVKIKGYGNHFRR